MKYAQSAAHIIGNTPLVRLSTIVGKTKHTILAKVEYMNPGGSVKDRMALQIIEDAEKAGKLKQGGTLVEATGSGNTGIALAMIAAIKGYKIILTMPDKNSIEKINTLKAYGAEVIVCPTAVAPDDPRSYYKTAERIADETSGAYYTRQYFNPSNAKAHYHTTGREIWEQTNGEIDYFVAGMGTGGTITGTSKYLKERSEKVQVLGIDAVGSIYKEYFDTGTYVSKPKTYLIEGIGEDFVPDTIDLAIVDSVVQVSDKEAYQMSRRLAREEGLLVGSSSGAAVAGLIKFLETFQSDEPKTFVVLLPDSGKSYLSKIFNDDWMQEKGLL